MTIALLDGDILVYRIGFSNEDELEHVALVSMDNYIEEILYGSGCSEYEVFLTGKNNFRKALYPAYKAHRKAPRPKHYDALRKHLIDVEGAVVSDGQEADDELGIRQTYETMICSIDKDLKQISGRHYDFVKRVHSTVTPEEGDHFLWVQTLTGDATDNIKGIYGIGSAKAEKILEGCITREEYGSAVLSAYKKEYPYCTEVEVISHINLIGRLVYIRRNPNEVWSLDGISI
jgi:5'-3' exonuclease